MPLRPEDVSRIADLARLDLSPAEQAAWSEAVGAYRAAGGRGDLSFAKPMVITTDALIGNEKNENTRFCFAKPGEVYLVYLPEGGTANLDLSGVNGTFTVQWFNPRSGGDLVNGSVATVRAGGLVALGTPPAESTEDWLAVMRR